MNEHEQAFDHREQAARLSQWLQGVLATEEDGETESYHLHFYQQLPNYIMALLQKEPQANLHYAPLLFHLAGCSVCRAAYIELYAALRAATQPGEGQQLALAQRTASLQTIPPRALIHLSQSFIRQAEAALRQARHTRADARAMARSLLQQAIRISARVTQSNLRSRALQDLVRVATLFEESEDTTSQGQAMHSYSPVLAGAGSQGRTVRGAETMLRPAGTPPGQHVIRLQANMLEGSITQHDNTLELHLHGLDKTLRNQYLIISVPLGSLIEPVRWLGGNPRAIRSRVPVDEQGRLSTPLGETALRLSNAEERNLLEAIFMLLEVRVAG